MGRGQMRNLERLGVGTGDINEFEYQKNQGELTEQLEHQGDREGAAPEATTTAERVQQVITDAHEKVEERKRKGLNRAAKKAPARKAAAKKPAAKKLTGRRSPAKKSAKKSAARKSAKTSTTKSAAKKSTKKAAAKKSTARKR